MVTVIRLATPADLDHIGRWGRALYEVERVFEPRMQFFGDHYRERDAQQLSNPDVLYLIAEVQNQPVGYLAAATQTLPAYLSLSGREGVIEVIYLEAFSRGKGIADKLAEACFGWFREKGVERVRAGVYAQNRASVKLFERFGLQPYHVTMMKAFD